MRTAPPGRASMLEPVPHQEAQRAVSVKKRKAFSRGARIVTVRSRRYGRLIMAFHPFLAYVAGAAGRAAFLPVRRRASAARAHRPTCAGAPPPEGLTPPDARGKTGFAFRRAIPQGRLRRAPAIVARRPRR